MKVDSSGTFGDSFGVINALFSGCAFAGIIYSIYLQNKELRLQRQELSLQRKELKLTRTELARSADSQALLTKAQNSNNNIQMELLAAQITSNRLDKITSRISAYGSLVLQTRDLDKLGPQIRSLIKDLENFEDTTVDGIPDPTELHNPDQWNF